nr:MAG TPA: hypothetical protein [Caudoviricetes sp.]DAR60038.1 MAG TPA: hypothetical protein [Caudoviricetes sp.]
MLGFYSQPFPVITKLYIFLILKEDTCSMCQEKTNVLKKL